MVELLEVNVEDFTVKPSAFTLEIEPFKSIVKRDKGSKGDSQGRNKLQAKRELLYIWLSTDHRSPYLSYEESVRDASIKRVLEFEDSWKPDELVQQGIEVYTELTTTDLIKLLVSARSAIYKLGQFYQDLDFSEKDDKGKLVYTPNMVTGSLKDLGNVSNNMMELEKQVRTMTKSGATRGGVSKSKYNT
jgi:hypothetical protein